jgi:hypothetical protein
MKSMIIALSAITLIATARAGFAKSVSSKTPRALPVTLRVKRLVPTQSADNNLRRLRAVVVSTAAFFVTPLHAGGIFCIAGVSRHMVV